MLGNVQKNSFAYQEEEREYLVHLPESYDPEKKYPLVFVLHGIISRAKAIAGFSDFNCQADEKEFIVCYPQGYKKSWGINVPVGPAPKAGIDDVGFISSLIDTLASHYSIDTNNVFSCGISNGAYMSMRLACELSERISGVALICGNMFEPVDQYCEDSRPVPIMFVAGMDDPLVHFEGNKMQGEDYRFTGYPKAVDYWTGKNNCTYPDDTLVINNFPDDKTYVVKKYNEEPQKHPVVLYRIHGGGHAWPGRGKDWKSAFLGNISSEIEGSAVISDFFMKLVK